MHTRIVAALAATMCVLAVAGTGVSQAACGQSTANTQAFSDTIGDDDGGLAPDIMTTTIGIDAACNFSVQVALADGRGRDELISDEAILVYVDTDANPATGSPVFKGADRVVITDGEIGSDDAPTTAAWNAAAGKFDFAGAQQLAAPGLAAMSFSASVDQFGLAVGTIGVYVGTLYSGIYDSYSDFSPEPGGAALPLAVAYGAPAPPPPAPVVQAPVTAPVVTTQSTTANPKPFVCRHGNLIGLTLATARARLHQLGCTVKVVYKARRSGRNGRVLSTKTSGGRVTLTVRRVRGKGAKRALLPAASAHAAAIEARFESLVTGR